MITEEWLVTLCDGEYEVSEVFGTLGESTPMNPMTYDSLNALVEAAVIHATKTAYMKDDKVDVHITVHDELDVDCEMFGITFRVWKSSTRAYGSMLPTVGNGVK